MIRKTQEKENGRKKKESKEFGQEGGEREGEGEGAGEGEGEEERETICRRIVMVNETLNREKNKGEFCCVLSNITLPLCQIGNV